MHPSMIRMHLQALFVAILLPFAYGQDRQIISQLNPGCFTCDATTTLVHIRADGIHDTIHQIWDFTRGMPTVIYVIGKPGCNMTISWDGSEPSKIELTGQPLYSFAAAIDQIYEYDDCHDRGHIDHQCPQRQLSLRDVSWKRADSVLTDKEAMLRMHGLYAHHSKRGVVDIKLDLLPFTDYAVELPHLIHTANSTLIDVSLENFTSSFNASRFALHFVMVSTDDARDSMNYTMRKSLDDEHTPGVFEIIEIRTPMSRTSASGGFMQFGPVAYTEPERSVSSSTNAYISNFNKTSIPARSTLSILKQLYAHNDLPGPLVQDMFISFGLPGDGYYKQHNYTSWSLSYGSGAPPVERVSSFVLAIVGIGVGVPVLLALSGIAFVLVRKCKRRNPPMRFTDEE